MCVREETCKYALLVWPLLRSLAIVQIGQTKGGEEGVERTTMPGKEKDQA